MPDQETCPYCGSDDVEVKDTPFVVIFKCKDCGYICVTDKK